MIEFNSQQFYEDVCIAIAGKRNHILTAEERLVYRESSNRLEQIGCKLILERGAQVKYDRLKSDVERFKTVCTQDNIPLED